MENGPAQIQWTELGEFAPARWRSEAGLPPPEQVRAVDDRLTADGALRQLRQGSFLLYQGDWVNARQLLAALGRRLDRRRAGKAPPSPAEAFRRERDRRAEEHRLLSRILVVLDGDYKVTLKRGPALKHACEPLWGPPDGTPQVAPLRELFGMIGAAEWRKKGVDVPGLSGRLHPHYGVFTPTRGEYPTLLGQAPRPQPGRVFDIGTGTGVLGLILLARGANEVVATDTDPRAVACATENAERLGFADKFTAVQTDLFPEGQADLIVCNPPWVPERPRTALDHAVYDPGGVFLSRFLGGAKEHLRPGGEVWLVLSDLAERLGLRPAGEVERLIAEAGLAIRWTREVRPRHAKTKDREDPLHAARAGEIVKLYCLVPAEGAAAGG